MRQSTSSVESLEVEHEHANINKAIITGICDRTISMEEIAVMAGSKWAKRIERKSGGLSVETNDILLGFEGPIPDTVEFGLITVRVRSYIPLPVRCISRSVNRLGTTPTRARAKSAAVGAGGTRLYAKP